MHKNLLFLDFDGVLFDTLREAYVVAVLTYGKYKSMNDIDFNSDHYKKFKKLRYLISPAWNYKYLLDCLEEESMDILSIKKQYLHLIKKAKEAEYNGFENLFFNKRNILKNEHYEYWIRLNAPFSFLNEISRIIYNNPKNIYIITTKDKQTVLKLLNLENIFIVGNHIFDKDDYKKFGSKKNIIKTILGENTDEAIFIDDSDTHINDCESIKNLHCLQPNWGYVSLESKTFEQSEIVSIIKNIFGV